MDDAKGTAVLLVCAPALQLSASSPAVIDDIRNSLLSLPRPSVDLRDPSPSPLALRPVRGGWDAVRLQPNGKRWMGRDERDRTG